MSAALTEPAVKVSQAEMYLVIPRLKWEQYEMVTGAIGDRPALKTIFVDGRLTLLSPTRRHDWHERALGRLVEAVADGLGIESEPAGHATYRRKDVEVGIEGDETYYFGAHAELMRGPVDVDLASQPPPDLAIEVEVTHPADDAVAVWGRLGVPEVWRLNTKRWTLVFGLLQPDGTYAPSPRSAALPLLEPGDVLAQLRLAEQLGLTRWRAQLDGWVRGTILPRRGARARKKAPKKGGPKR
jgi:Uma2 family endonuclease